LKKAWKPVAGLVLLAAIALLVVAYGKRTDALPVPITAPHPVATTTPVAPNAFMGINLTGQAAIVYDLSNGQTLYSENADRQLPLASLTKLLSVYAGASAFSPSTVITMSASAIAAEGESGLLVGETYSFRDLARFALVASSNDAAEAIAEEAAARRGTTMKEALSGTAASVGLTKTYAVNGSGLDISTSQSGGYGSARDMALLAGALLKKSPDLASATTESSVTIYSGTGMARSLPNTNQGVVTVPGILLSKTGFTDLAGGNLVVVFDVGIGHPVAVVVLGSTREGRFSDVNRLIDATHEYFAGASQ
jgi:D-alanyl-D-alanine carboxypeptidase/D-alanyl-D-alanine carboxypeptidase (penicillin-binding protein 5/6)